MTAHDRPGRSLITRDSIRAEVHASFSGLAARRRSPPVEHATTPRDPTALVLGRDAAANPVSVPLVARSAHTGICGASGSGKSTLMAESVRQDISLGAGGCILDPHGDHSDSLYRTTLKWLSETSLSSDRICHLIDPASDYVTGINSAELPSSFTEPSVIAGLLLETVERARKDEDTTSKPTMQRVLKGLFGAIAELRLTLAQAHLLIDPTDPHGIRKWALTVLKDPFCRAVLARIDALGADPKSRQSLEAELIGPLNRLATFESSPAVRNILGQAEHTLDIRQAMDEGHVILANLSGNERIYESDAELLGRILVRLIFFHAKRRRNPKRPFFLYLDECQRYLSGDVEQLLGEARKFGTFCVLGHQWQAQLGQPDDPLRQAVANGTNVKITFRIKDPRDAADIALAQVPLQLEHPVETLTKPTVVGHRRILFRNGSVGRQDSRSSSTGISVTDSIARTETESYAETLGTNTTRSVTDTTGISSSDSISDMTGWNRSSSVVDTTGRNSSFASSRTAGESSSRGTSDSRSAGNSFASGSSSGLSVNFPAGTDAIAERRDLRSIGRPIWGSNTPYTRNLGSDASRSDDTGHSTSNSSSAGTNSATTSGETHGTSRSRAVGSTIGTSGARTLGHTTGRSQSHAVGRSVGESRATTRGTSIGNTTGRSVGRTLTEGTTEGTSASWGWSEGIEPIYELLPTAVHSIENVKSFQHSGIRSLEFT